MVCPCVLSHFRHVRLFSTLSTVAHQAPLSMGFSRQEYWNGLPHPPPGDLPHPGNEPGSPAFQTESLPLCHQGSPARWYITTKLCDDSFSFFSFHFSCLSYLDGRPLQVLPIITVNLYSSLTGNIWDLRALSSSAQIPVLPVECVQAQMNFSELRFSYL